MGPAALEMSQEALGFGNFNMIAAAAGVVLVLGMQMIKEGSERNGN